METEGKENSKDPGDFFDLSFMRAILTAMRREKEGKQGNSALATTGPSPTCRPRD